MQGCYLHHISTSVNNLFHNNEILYGRLLLPRNHLQTIHFYRIIAVLLFSPFSWFFKYLFLRLCILSR